MMLWTARARAESARHIFPLLLSTLILVAWLALWLWGTSPYGRYLSHHALDEVRGGGLAMLIFIAGWTLMTVAMMLPTSLPLIVLFRGLVRQRPARRLLVALLLSGYLLVWTVFGALVYAGDAVLHALVASGGWLATNAWLLGAGTLVLSGLYQFTPLKYHCLDKCRSPFGFITAHWHGRDEHREALRLGLHHGLFCVGCCWALMLLMFAIGAGNLGWMLALGAVMAVQKNVSWGRRLSAPLGVALVAWGLAVAVAAG